MRLFSAGGRFGALLGLLGLFLAPAPALAGGCFAAVADASPAIVPAALRLATAGEIGLSFLGHASFLIESPGGVEIVTDYNGINRPARLPDIVTMNHAHPTHYTDRVEPGIKVVLRGWDTGGGIPHYDVKYGDVHIRNVPTNIRDGAGTEFGGNPMPTMEMAENRRFLTMTLDRKPRPRPSSPTPCPTCPTPPGRVTRRRPLPLGGFRRGPCIQRGCGDGRPHSPHPRRPLRRAKSPAAA